MKRHLPKIHRVPDWYKRKIKFVKRHIQEETIRHKSLHVLIRYPQSNNQVT